MLVYQVKEDVFVRSSEKMHYLTVSLTVSLTHLTVTLKFQVKMR